MLTTFSFGVSSTLLQQKCPIVEIKIIGVYFSEGLFWENIPMISAIELFCCDKFEKKNPNEKVVNMSKLTKPYFSRTAITSAFSHCTSILKLAPPKTISTGLVDGPLVKRWLSCFHRYTCSSDHAQGEFFLRLGRFPIEIKPK